LFSAGQPVGYEHTVATVWQLAFDQIAARPVAHELLAVCASMGGDRIPRELLETFARHSALAGINGQDVDDAIAMLLGYALLTPSVQDTFGMHRLIAQLTRQRADPDSQRSAAGLAVTMLAGLWPDRSWEHLQWPACQRLLAPALTATEHAREHGVARGRTAWVLAGIGLYQQARGEDAIAIEEVVYGAQHTEVAQTLNTLAGVQLRVAKPEAARASLDRVLTILEAVNGPAHPEVAKALRKRQGTTCGLMT